MASKSLLYLMMLSGAFSLAAAGEPANDKCHEMTAKLEMLSLSIDRLSTVMLSKNEVIICHFLHSNVSFNKGPPSEVNGECECPSHYKELERRLEKLEVKLNAHGKVSAKVIL